MEAVIKKWGNSLGIRIPSVIAKETLLGEGSCVEIENQNGQIIIRPINNYNLHTMIKEITDSNKHNEMWNDLPVGKEAW